MSKQYILSESDHRQIEEILRWFGSNSNLRDRLRKRNRPGSGGGGGISKAFARIVKTLRREDEAGGLAAIDYYEIELLAYPIADWSADHGMYYVDDRVKYNDKIYLCKIEHDSSVSLPPTATSHWMESTYHKAWVFGYSGDLLEAVPWLQPGDIVEVINYTDSRWPVREWWIMETVFRVEEEGTDAEDGAPTVNCSLAWNVAEKRVMAVYS